MHNEQVFTPRHVINTMFEELEYKGEKIRKKHIIDNSCGDGAILVEVVKTYINVCIMTGVPKEETIRELETYVHGIEIDERLHSQTLKNLDRLAESYSLYNVKWDIRCGDATRITSYDGSIDYVIGNPPYCNIHDIPEKDREWIKRYAFANGGMTDMYLVFFDLGLSMLNENGKLAYITPNSWLTSTAGVTFRNYLKNSRTLLEIYQYGHRKVFEDANTYTCITILSRQNKSNNLFVYRENVEAIRGLWTVRNSVLNLDECFIGGKIYLCDNATHKMISEIENVNTETKSSQTRIKVKNGFATLNDKLFIIDDYKGQTTRNIITVVKASNGETHRFFYPYDENGKPMKFNDIDNDLCSYILDKAEKMGLSIESDEWYLYGRTQALNDVKYRKICINNLVRTKEDLKITEVNGQEGVYSGFYIPLYDYYVCDKYDIIRTINNDDFIKYIKAVGKYKNGGYYTFSTKEIESWINYKIKKGENK